MQYQKLTPMLLNEAQKQNRHSQQQDETIQQQYREIEALEARLEGAGGFVVEQGSDKATDGQ